MCGRFSLFTPPARLADLFDADLAPDVDPVGRPRWNVAPTTDVLGLSAGTGPPGEERRPRLLDCYRWGLIPPWAGDASSGSRLFNARAETAASKPSFRDAFVERRVAVLADGFFEWQKGPGKKRRPHYFYRVDGDPLAFAGLWGSWRGHRIDGQTGPSIRSCTIITTNAGQDMDGIHPRMPVVLERSALDRWLDPANTDRAELQSLLRPAAPGTLVHHPVDQRVGNVRNDDPGVIAPTVDRPA